MKEIKNIAIVAHDNRKKDLIEWVKYNKESLISHRLICTGTTGKLVQNVLGAETDVTLLKSGPLGGDQQLGAMITEGQADMLIFFWDPMEPQPHDVDIKALLRISVLYNIPTACNRSTADFIISSMLFSKEYNPKTYDYSAYTQRKLK